MPARPRTCVPLPAGLLKLHDNSFLTTAYGGDKNPLALIVINGIGLISCFDHLWEKARFTLCADGGANKLYDYIKRDSVASAKNFVPQYIKGDLDSIRPEVASYFQLHGAQVIQDPDQESNDLDKCLTLLQALQGDLASNDQGEPIKLNVLVVGAMGGRFDQEMQNVNALFQWQRFRPQRFAKSNPLFMARSSIFHRMTLVSDSTSAVLLAPGKHCIRPNFDVEGRKCGLIPIGGSCERLTTHGLKWNLTNHSTVFGGLVSTSNHVLDHEVHVETSDPLIWTTELVS
ncbi:thiamine pyrophosphokinase [Aphanomyces invadans]|uniref:Thiamine pyrophosphokinase n=1 Tax=Aphanomyces invadans TaxID=157072 RepID=A0A024UQL3_9STRA|nr:thiamine pyrophosphokinase [Aphanomyces invadans]ETW08450.1 thiamine pyrophosphokinase [Aphanomyces invadans]|eukprot:XP_008862255.1 thiamine pyrophosphokinase [Aphanomyces invadans]